MQQKATFSNLIFSILFCFTFLHHTYCMKPTLEQSNDPQLTEIRKNLGKGIFTDKTPKIVYQEQFNDRLGKCLNYALTYILEIIDHPEQLKIINTADWLNNLNIIQYFDQIDHPEKNDLVVYYANAITDEPLHFGIITGFNPENNEPLVASKWGIRPEVFEHELFAVPLIYGNTIKFFRIKNEYMQPGAKATLIKKIQQSINSSELSQKSFFLLQFALLQLASGKDISNIETALHLNKKLSPIGKMVFLLKEYPGVDINTRNQSGKTLLMLAAQRNDYKMVELLLKCKADVHKKDNNGTTALMLTTDQSIIYLLRQYGAIGQ